MQIGIVTIYQSSNYGALWQANALRGYLEDRGHDVFFVRHNARNLRVMYVKELVSSLLRRKLTPGKARFLTARLKKIQAVVDRMPKRGADEAKKADLILLGSDEIWNVSRDQIYNYPIFCGRGLGESVASYSPSVNTATEEDFAEHPVFVDSIRRLKSVSVRDEGSKRVVENATGRADVEVTVDPTLLHDRAFYEAKAEPCEISSPFILVYSYGDHVRAGEKEQLIALAREKQLKLVSILTYLDWCDVNMAVTPGQMLSLFRDADSVATDTFHGLMFSLIYQKNFLVISQAMPKFRNALREFSVTERLNGLTIPEQFEQPIDYTVVSQAVRQRREVSFDYLNRLTSDA